VFVTVFVFRVTVSACCGWFNFALHSCVDSRFLFGFCRPWPCSLLKRHQFSQVHYICSMASGTLVCQAVSNIMITCHSIGRLTI